MTHSAEQVASVLKGIQARIPKLLLKNAVREELLTPTVSMVMEKALLSPSISEEKKKKIRELKDAGEFSKKHVVDNPQVQKQINNFVSREINKAIKDGRLPPRSKIKDVDFIRDMYKKMQEK